MIVACPACRTRFNHAGEASSTVGCCSRCGAEVPLAAIRTYRLRDTTPAAGLTMMDRRSLDTVDGTSGHRMLPTAPLPSLRIGMDDPSLRSRLTHTALETESYRPGTPLTYFVVQDTVPEVAEATVRPENAPARLAAPSDEKATPETPQVLEIARPGAEVAWRIAIAGVGLGAGVGSVVASSWGTPVGWSMVVGSILGLVGGWGWRAWSQQEP